MSSFHTTGGIVRRSAAIAPLALLIAALPTPARADAIGIAADTTCLASGGTAPRTTLTSTRIASRSTTEPTLDSSTDPTAGTVAGSVNYREGKCRNGSATGYYDLWDPIAAASGLSADQQIAAWKEIGVVALAYKHLLERQPTPAETQADVAA
jgi:hypothetical protein